MGRARKIEDEQDARRCLLAAELAGQSAGEWGRTHGIDGRSLHAWQVNLARGRAIAPRRPREPRPAPATRALVELVPTASGAASTVRYVLEVAGARVEFGDDASTATLRRVLEALRSC